MSPTEYESEIHGSQNHSTNQCPQLNLNLQSMDHKTRALTNVPQLNLNLQSMDHKTRALTNVPQLN